MLKLIASGEYPMFTRILMDATLPRMDPDARFDRGLGPLLDGITANLPPRPASYGNDVDSRNV